MGLSLEEYRVKLINKILMANNEQEVCRYCDTAMRSLEQNKLNGHLLLRFTERVTTQLEGFNPGTKNLRQWGNIETARNYFICKKERLQMSQEK